MTEQDRREQRGNSAPAATRDGSRQKRSRTGVATAALAGSDAVAKVVLALGLIAGILMLASLISTVASVDVANGSCNVIYDSNPDLAKGCSLSGYERHSIAFVLLGLLACAMAIGAGPARSRGAALGLVVIGAVALVFALFSDLPVTNDTGAIGRDFEGATASAGTGLWLELLGGVLALLAGALRLLAPRPRPSSGGRSGDPRRAAPRHDAHAGHGAAHERPTDAARAERRAARAAARKRTPEE
jgi:hypothetical protein